MIFKTMLFPSLKKVKINTDDVLSVIEVGNDDHCKVWLEGRTEPLELACQAWRIMQACRLAYEAKKLRKCRASLHIEDFRKSCKLAVDCRTLWAYVGCREKEREDDC